MSSALSILEYALKLYVPYWQLLNKTKNEIISSCTSH